MKNLFLKNESVEKSKFPQEYEDGGINILDDLKEKEKSDPKVQAMFKRSRHNDSSILIFNQEYYELPKTMIRVNGKNYHILKPKKFRDVLKIYQDKISMDMNLNEFQILTSTCWNEKHQPLTIDMTQDK